MSRVVCALAAAAIAAWTTMPASADDAAASTYGLPVAPNGGNTSLHQWGGVDDLFAVNPDADGASSSARHKSASPLAKDQQDADGDGQDDPDTEHAGEVLSI